jgi:hypothetical protein
MANAQFEPLAYGFSYTDLMLMQYLANLEDFSGNPNA